jgi:hypothetical protein
MCQLKYEYPDMHRVERAPCHEIFTVKTSCTHYEEAQNCHHSAVLSDHLAHEKALGKALWMALWMAHERALWMELLTALCPSTPAISLSTPCHPLPPLAVPLLIWAPE